METETQVHVAGGHPGFQELIVWRRAIELCVAIYKITASFPDSERFGLTNQLRRAAVSVSSNIAEGYGRTSRGEYVQFLGHARGSNCEVQTQLVIAKALGFVSDVQLQETARIADEIGRMLVAMIKKLKNTRD